MNIFQRLARWWRVRHAESCPYCGDRMLTNRRISICPACDGSGCATQYVCTKCNNEWWR